MGIGMWVVAGAGAFLLGRLVRAGRPRAWIPEAMAGGAAALVAGLVATAMDFGGLQEPDWRAGVFALLVAAAVIGLVRLGRVILERRRGEA